jgi:NADH dehydrogenase FAD-containing subunit
MEGVRIERFARGRSLYVTGEIPHDLALLCAGFVGPELPKSAGLAVNAHGRMLVDEHLAWLSHPEIRGAGDAAVSVASVGAPMLMSCRIAQPMVTYVADDIVREHEGKHRPPFRYRDVLRCISLGRSDGIVQFQRPDGALRNGALRGPVAAWVKESICRLTILSLAYERLRARLAATGANTPRLKERAA